MKTLTPDLIPEGFSWAAVDQNGYAYAYKSKPISDGCDEWIELENENENPFQIGEGFNPKNWENSLVSRANTSVESSIKERTLEEGTMCDFEKCYNLLSEFSPSKDEHYIVINRVNGKAIKNVKKTELLAELAHVNKLRKKLINALMS
jgi:hypothetical protein